MQLPVEISPNPLVISTVELRFTSTLNEESVLPTIFPIFSKELPSLSNSKIPRELANSDEVFKYSPDFTLSNESYSMSISNRVISFENVNEYTLWDNYFSFIKKQLKTLFELNIITTIERIGVRYGSIFDDSFDQILRFNPTFSIDGYDESLVHNRTEFKKNNITLTLQIAKAAKIIRNSKTQIGTLIDIDASYTNGPEFKDDIFQLIDELHTAEKTLFFELLQPDYLKNLNPKY